MKIKDKENKLIGLEIVRFVSAFAILVWHYQHFLFFEDRAIDFIKDLQPFFSHLNFFYDWGLYGVEIFWCVSGFIFFWKYKNLIIEKKISAKNFFLLRFSRLYPLHFITLLIAVLLQTIYFKTNGVFFVYQFNDLYHFILQIFFISNWGFEEGLSFNGVIWSISIEVLVYLFFFLTLKYIIISRSLVINFLIIIFSLLILFTEDFQNIFNYSAVVSCFCLFYAGGIAATLYDKFKDEKRITFIFICLSFVTPLLINIFELYKIENWLTVFLLIYAPICLFLFAKIRIQNSYLAQMLNILGNLTYSSYLIHVPMQMIIVLVFSYMSIEIPFYNNYFFIFYLFSILITSRIVFCYYEKPIQNKIRKYFLN